MKAAFSRKASLSLPALDRRAGQHLRRPPLRQRSRTADGLGGGQRVEIDLPVIGLGQIVGIDQGRAPADRREARRIAAAAPGMGEAEHEGIGLAQGRRR